MSRFYDVVVIGADRRVFLPLLNWRIPARLS